jgi:hypothetical protein
MGKKATHTAGPCPLKVTGPHLSGKFVIVTAHGNHYATTYDPAAARLIAAAPDLLDAAKNARDVLAALVTGDSPTLAELRAAIDKATGGEEPTVCLCGAPKNSDAEPCPENCGASSKGRKGAR